MQVKTFSIPGILILEPKIYNDNRGFFFESYNLTDVNKILGKELSFVQDNHSKSKCGVLRGLHYQLPPKAQGKLVRVIQGEVFDVVVDLRKNSPTFGEWLGIILSAENKRQLWLPEGFAHGFLTLSETSEFLYKTTDYWSPEHERCILWNDPDIGIQWPLKENIVLSPKDKCGLPLYKAPLFDI